MLEPGDRIGDWVVDGPLGAGGMGTVFRCHNALTERITAAVKVVQADRFDDVRERFLREVESLEKLQHPAIVRVKGWGEERSRGWLWLAMDLVSGEELGQRLRRGPLPTDQVVAVFRDLADGLAHAHARNVFHRDIKPANVMLLPDGGARLVDFGIAMHAGRTRVSTAGTVPGTPAYLAPEVFGGVPRAHLLDVYALGQVLHEALTGQPAFPEPDVLTTTQRLAHLAGQKMRATALDPGPGVPAQLRAVVQRATDPDPGRRLQTMDQFRAALDGEPIPDAVAAPETMMLDLDAIEVEASQAPPAPSAPVATSSSGTTVEAPTGPPPGGRPARALVVVAVLIAASIVLAWALRTPGPRDVEVLVTGVAAGTPLWVRVGGEAATPGEAFTFQASDLPPGEVDVAVAGGRSCQAQGWIGGTCPACCGCASATLAVDQARATVAVVVPSDTATVRVRATGVAPPWPLVADLEGHASVGASRGVWAFPDVVPGTYTLKVEAGACPEEAAGCGAECPHGCSSVLRRVAVSCDAPDVVVDVPLTTPSALAVPVPPTVARPTARPPTFAVEVETTTGPRFPSLKGVKVRVVHHVGDLLFAETIAARFQAQGAVTEPWLASGGPMEKYYGFVYHYGDDLEPAAREAQRLLLDLGYVTISPEQDDPDLDLAVWLDND